MSNAVAIQVADAIVAEMSLPAQVALWLPQTFTVERRYAELTQFEDFPAGSLKVFVVPLSLRNPALNRAGTRAYEYQPHILIYAKPSGLVPESPDNSLIDPYTTLAETISDYWSRFPVLSQYSGPCGRDGARVTEAMVDPICDPDILLGFGIVASDIGLTVSLAR